MSDARFTDALWTDTGALRAAIHALPFNRELAAGTLDRDRFRHYITQDALYLRRYGRALAAIAAKADTDAGVRVLAHSAHVAIEVEQAMHGDFLDRLEVPAAAMAEATMAPTCQAYTDFLVRTAAVGELVEAVGAVLPCAWGYLEVADALEAAGRPEDDRYADWIGMYTSEEFREATRWLEAELDRLADGAGAAARDRAEAAFTVSLRYEHAFWEMCWSGEAADG